MEKSVLTVSVGIPAYNEAANIRQLLKALLAQQQDGFTVKEIIVVSDGSTDRTAASVRSIADRRIQLVELRQREGKFAAQNRIVAGIRGDVLVILDADVLPGDEDFLQEIVSPLQQNERVGLVGADVLSAPPRGIFESVIACSHTLKRRVFKQLHGGDNVYLCHGRARAFSRAFCRQLRWPDVFSEDAYSYLACRRDGLRFVFAPAARVIFRSPRTLADHAKQSGRFSTSKRQLVQHFDHRFVHEHFHIPAFVLLSASAWSLVHHPLLTLSYGFIMIGVRVYERLRPLPPATYEVATSSKDISI
jgi:glycosyltransferase involved in cell wall biosynthesis